MLVAHQRFQMPCHQQFVFDDQHARRMRDRALMV
jgi:hypothetical protein